MGSSRPKILGAYLTERLSVYDCPRELRRGLFRTLWCGAKRTSWCWRSTRSRRASRKRKLTALGDKSDEEQAPVPPTSPQGFVRVGKRAKHPIIILPRGRRRRGAISCYLAKTSGTATTA